jgi:hypothetical protein
LEADRLKRLRNHPLHSRGKRDPILALWQNESSTGRDNRHQT